MASLYLDEDVHQRVIVLLETRGHSVTHARTQAKGASDDVQLMIATHAARVLVTCNRKDFVLLHGAWNHWSRDWGVSPQHAGVLVIRNDWPPELTVQHVHEFFALGLPTANRLYRYVAERGWEAHVLTTL